MKHNQTCLTTLSFLALAISASGALVYSTDFESDTVGEAPVTPWAATQNALVRNDTTATPFGPSKNYLESQGRAVGGNGFRFLRNESPNSTIISDSFDLVWPTGNTNDTLRIVARGNSTVNSERPLNQFDVGVGVGDILVGASGTDITFDIAVHFDIVYNFTGTTETYGGTTVDSNSFDVWLDGALVIDNQAMDNATNLANPANTVINDTGYWHRFNAASALGEIYFDNFSQSDDAVVTFNAVPEPSIALSGLASLLFFGFRRKRK